MTNKKPLDNITHSGNELLCPSCQQPMLEITIAGEFTGQRFCHKCYSSIKHCPHCSEELDYPNASDCSRCQAEWYSSVVDTAQLYCQHCNKYHPPPKDTCPSCGSKLPSVVQMIDEAQRVGNSSPDDFEFRTKLPATATINFECLRCGTAQHIPNPSSTKSNKDLQPLEGKLLKGGCAIAFARALATIVSLSVGGALFAIVNNVIIGGLLFLLVSGILFYLIRDGMASLFGVMYNIGYMSCINCSQPNFIAYNSSSAWMLKKTKGLVRLDLLDDKSMIKGRPAYQADNNHFLGTIKSFDEDRKVCLIQTINNAKMESPYADVKVKIASA